MKVGGKFYFEVPVGKVERVQFNAHRIFRPATIIEAVSPTLELERFDCVHETQTRVIPYISGNGKDLSEILRMTDEITDRFLGLNDSGIFVFQKTQMID